MGVSTAALTVVVGLQIGASFSAALLTMAATALASLLFLPVIHTHRKVIA
ncbi:hypothetical protein [Rathayibacter toxicus]|nr:hypothetical protein [Rathayibacter toxicus]